MISLAFDENFNNDVIRGLLRRGRVRWTGFIGRECREELSREGKGGFCGRLSLDSNRRPRVHLWPFGCNAARAGLGRRGRGLAGLQGQVFTATPAHVAPELGEGDRRVKGLDAFGEQPCHSGVELAFSRLGRLGFRVVRAFKPVQELR
jgi:hypothetical protein